MPHPLLRYFAYDHLWGNRREVSRKFAHLAKKLDRMLPDHEPAYIEKTVALRKLLEAKDAAVRAVLDEPERAVD